MHTIHCSEIWGGNHKIDTEVCAGALTASLFSRGTDGEKGGDLYFFSVCGREMLTRIAIADVTGHGQAVSSTSHWLYRSMVSHMNDLEGNLILSDLNNMVKHEGTKALTTAQIITFNKGDSHLHFSSAGHPPVLIKKAGESQWGKLTLENPTQKGNLPLGVIENTVYDRECVCLNANDSLFLYTDGVLEARNKNGQLFGMDQLLNVLNRNSGGSAQEIKTAALDSLLEFSGGKFEHDDVTMMALKVH
jgi:phosphoserine phosphatase RsbU/P